MRVPAQTQSGRPRTDMLDGKLCKGPCHFVRLHPRKLQKLQRCNAGERWEPNSFNPLMWGQNMLKRLDKDNQPQEAERVEASEQADDAIDPEVRPAEEAISRQHPEVDTVDEALTAALDKRRQDYRHLVFCGRDVTTDYPESETPTWDSWQAAIELSSGSAQMYREWSKSLDEAIQEEDYATAAELKKTMDEISAEDTVNTFIQDYRLAIEEENFDKASELLQGCSIDLCGWWSVNTPDAEVGNHVLRISKAFNRYKFDAFSPEELADLHGMTPELSSEESLGDIEIGSEAYDCLGTTVADLHFLPFPSASDASGQRIYSLATAIAAPPKDKDTDGRIVSEGKIANSGLLGKSLQDSTLNDPEVGARLMDVLEMTKKMLQGDSDRPSDSTDEISIELQPGQIIEDSSGVQIVVDAEVRPDEEVEEDVSESLLNGIQSRRAKPQTRVPLNLLRTEKDRLMLIVAPTASSVTSLQEAQDPQSPGTEAEEESSESKSSEGSSRVSIIAIEGKASAEDIAAKLKDLMNRDPGPSPEARSLWDEAEKNFKRRLKDEGSDNVDDAPKNKRREMMKNLAKHVMSLMNHRTRRHISSTGLKGAVGYSRIRLPESTTDPFSGIFIGMFSQHGPEVIEMRRTIGQDGKEYVEGVKITGDANVPAGKLTFRAAISPENRLPSTRYLPPELGIRARYKGQGQLAEAGFRNSRWVDGELWHLSSNNALGQAAEVGFLYSIGETKFLTPLNRIHLDDCLGDLTR